MDFGDRKNWKIVKNEKNTEICEKKKWKIIFAFFESLVFGIFWVAIFFSNFEFT